MTVPMIPFLCEICIHNQGFKPGLLKIYCDAFPNGVPDEILMEKIKHIDPIDGDNGIVFEPKVREDAKLNQVVQDIFEQTIKMNYKCKTGTVDDSNKCGDVVEKASFRSDWSDRTHDKVVDNPFIEGTPSKEKVNVIKEFIDKNKDKYNPTYIKFYHGTDPSIDIEKEGLLPTTKSRRRSFQSTSGYVYLANTPERAKVFGEMGNQGKSVVYEVIVPGHGLLADKDQLNNQRAAGVNVGNSVAESIVYGGGVRIKGKIEPWQIKRINA